MHRGDEAETTGKIADFERLVEGSRAWLAERGETIVGSGSFGSVPGKSGHFPISGSIHSDFGPPEQDKRINQDYALAWRPKNAAARGQPRLVLALADGLTNSFRSESAASIACWSSVRALVEACSGFSRNDGEIPAKAGTTSAGSPKERALAAFNRAGQSLGQLADAFIRDPEASCPEGQFVSTWKYILKKGGLFQTTLTLAWLDEEHFYLAMIGDGGALWRNYGRPAGDGLAESRVLAACDLESQQVHALGPAERSVSELDCWCEQVIGEPFLCALFTDGIGRGIGSAPFELVDAVEAIPVTGHENAAQCFVERAIRERSKAFDDNMTLAVIRGS